MNAYRTPIGVIECFFGPAWPRNSRVDYAAFLRENGFSFYVYGPKSDARLRKQWKETWPASYLDGLRTLATTYRENGVTFGVALSPFGLHERLDSDSEGRIKEKIDALTRIGIDVLGIFFDDMPNNEGLADRQIGVLRMIESRFSGQIVFCPTFYSFDPILDRVFGQRSPDYLSQIGESLPERIEILWTGPKVISEEISDTHLSEVTRLLKRKPFVCDNLFANDGPKNCKFIKFRTPRGRTPAALNGASHWAFNPMNQPALSRLALMAGLSVLRGDQNSESAFRETRERMCSKRFSSWLATSWEVLLNRGLDVITASERNRMISELATYEDAAAVELIDWLNGKYRVGNECLTD